MCGCAHYRIVIPYVHSRGIKFLENEISDKPVFDAEKRQFAYNMHLIKFNQAFQ